MEELWSEDQIYSGSIPAIAKEFVRKHLQGNIFQQKYAFFQASYNPGGPKHFPELLKA